MTPADPQKVLIADDDALNRGVLCELLQPGYAVLLAKNGAQTLERAARHLPDACAPRPSSNMCRSSSSRA